MRYLNYSDSNGFVVAETESPIPLQNEVLIRVTAFGINRADILQKQGKYPPPKGASQIIGMEVSGVVEKVGSDIHSALIGQRVCAMLTGGGYAELVVVPISQLIFLPQGADINHWAGVPEVFLTATQALFSIAKLQAAENVLIHAGASGVGTAAIQLATAIGANVYVTCSSVEKQNACIELGAAVAYNYNETDFVKDIKDQKFAMDVIVDVVAGEYLNRNVQVANLDGRIVQLAMLGGRYTNNLDMAKLLAKRITITASTLRNRSDNYKTELVDDFNRRFLPLFAEHKIKPVISGLFDACDVDKAHAEMEANKNIGKLVCVW